VKRVDTPFNQPSLSKSGIEPAVKRILFVCYANICRSPMAEAIMHDLVDQAGLSKRVIVDAAGTHALVGEPAYETSRQTLKAHGVSTIPSLSRQLEYDDLNTFDYVLAMDRRSLMFILQHSTGCRADIRLFLSFAKNIGMVDGDEVRDPFPDGDYNLTYRVIQAGCKALLRHLETNL
jgi:protein-tyrosine phosphatase